MTVASMVRKNTVKTIALLATAVVAMVGLGSIHGTAGARSSSQQVVVTGPERDFPPTCTPSEYGQRLSSLTDALLAVDRAGLEIYWGEGFRWFRVNDGRPNGGWGFDTESYSDGIEDLEKRGGLRMRIKEVKIARSGGGEVGGAFDGVYWTRNSRRKEDQRKGRSLLPKAGDDRPELVQLPARPRSLRGGRLGVLERARRLHPRIELRCEGSRR